jgi:hypothetical protein
MFMDDPYVYDEVSDIGTTATFMHSPQHLWKHGLVSVCLDRGHVGVCGVSLGGSRKMGESAKAPNVLIEN